jgi:hypothetical protein
MISEIFDDKNEPAFINFTSSDFGQLIYKYDGLDAKEYLKRSRFMNYDP